jgi:hypothetical protein
VRPAAIERDALLASRSHLHRRRWQLARDLAQLLCWHRDRAGGLHVGLDLGADRNIEIGTGEPDPLVRGLHQDIRQDGQCSLGRDARRDSCQPFLELLPGNREPHYRSLVLGMCKAGILLYLLYIRD